MKRFIYMLAAFALLGAASCQPDEEVAVHASFTTDKESYDVGDPVVLTNTSTAENAPHRHCKWELGKGVVSYETTPENISYDQAGEYVIKLTVTSDRGAKKSSFEKTILVVDNNIRPVADFTWSPEKVVAGLSRCSSPTFRPTRTARWWPGSGNSEPRPPTSRIPNSPSRRRGLRRSRSP